MVSQTGTRSLIDVAIPVDGRAARIARDVVLILLFTLITTGLARISVHLPFTPVPITGQTLAVLLAGAALGSRKGAAAMVVYAAGGSQLNMFAGGGDAIFHWQAGSGGYIFGITALPGLFGIWRPVGTSLDSYRLRSSSVFSVSVAGTENLG